MTLTGLSVTTPTIQRRHGDRKVEATHAFVGSEELKSATQNAAVVGAPTIWRPFLRRSLSFSGPVSQDGCRQLGCGQARHRQTVSYGRSLRSLPAPIARNRQYQRPAPKKQR